LVTSYIGANDYAWYVQDRWRPWKRLTITAGLRADWVSSQDWLFHVDTSHAWNYAPRVGGAYMLTKNQKNVIRASWGKVTDIPNASYFGNAGSNGRRVQGCIRSQFERNVGRRVHDSREHGALHQQDH
jgi:hypothetical protein